MILRVKIGEGRHRRFHETFGVNSMFRLPWFIPADSVAGSAQTSYDQ
jgi:hypothetical protein